MNFVVLLLALLTLLYGIKMFHNTVLKVDLNKYLIAKEQEYLNLVEMSVEPNSKTTWKVTVSLLLLTSVALMFLGVYALLSLIGA